MEMINTGRLVELCRDRGATMVALFGSVARGDAGPDSDIDLIVRFSEPKSLLSLVRMEREIAEALGRKVDLLTEGAISPHLRAAIERDTRVLYEA
ncbi:MAG: type VII toxin-antitoxin system MntA family adenylyltransferase antitoxin [bacterium]